MANYIPPKKNQSAKKLAFPLFGNNQVQDNTYQKKELFSNDPNVIKANKIKEDRRLAYIKSAEEEAKKKDRSGYVSGFKSTHKQDVETAKELANNRFNYNEQPWQDKAKSIAIEVGLGLLPELAFTRKLPFKNVINKESNVIPKSVTKSGERLLTDAELFQKRMILQNDGILPEQKTLNLPYKNIIHKGIDPYGYDIKEKLSSLKSLFKDSKNPMLLEDDAIKRAHATYQKEAISQNIEPISFDDFKSGFNPDQLEPSLRKVTQNKFERRFATEHPTGINSTSNKNRYATWNMYLGKPQTEHPLYDVSKLSTNKKTVYTIKEPYMNKGEVEQTLSKNIQSIEDLELSPDNAFLKRFHKSMKISKNKDGSFNVPDRDNPYFGTMGGFNWSIKKLDNGNYEAIANDIWDLQPFKNQIIGNSDKLSGRILNSVIKPFKNIEVGKTLGIGKPLDVKVGFNIDGKTKKIINTFGLTGVGLGLNKQRNKSK